MRASRAPARARPRTSAATAGAVKRERAGQDRRRGRGSMMPSHPQHAREQNRDEERQRAAERPEHPAHDRLAAPAQAREPVGRQQQRPEQQRGGEQAHRPRGHDLALQRQARLHVAEIAGAVSRASTALSDAAAVAFQAFLADGLARRPGRVRRTPARAPPACPPASSTPCSPAANGSARCASSPTVLGSPGSVPASCGDRADDRALKLQRGRCRSRRRRGSPTACARCAPARSPSTIAASIGPCSFAAARRLRARVAAAAAAGRDEHDRPLGLARGEHARKLEQRRRPRQFGLGAATRRASRWARITIGAAPVEPGRCAITVVERAPPSIVCALKRLHVHREAAAGRAAQPFERLRDRSAASASSPALPGGVRGTRPPVPSASRSACAPSNASGASVEVSGAGRAVERERRHRRARAETARRQHDRGVR